MNGILETLGTIVSILILGAVMALAEQARLDAADAVDRWAYCDTYDCGE